MVEREWLSAEFSVGVDELALKFFPRIRSHDGRIPA